MNLAQTKEEQQSSSGGEAGAWSENSGTGMQRQLNTGDGAGIPVKKATGILSSTLSTR